MGVLAKPIPFGNYFLLEKLNTGGMAEVYKAKTFGVEGFERIVAVKKILPTIAEDKEFISMFIDEAKIAVQLQHANIAQIFDLGNINGDYYIAMEYVAGHDLRVIFDRCVRTNHKLDIGCVCYIISKICEGLDYAHNKKDSSGEPMNIIHRDISPQNILISYDGDCKLIDFGIAKATNKSSATQVGILKGKFSYMSPEQVSGKANLDRRSDVFALGIVLYEMLTLKRLFLGASDFETLEKIRKVEVSPPTLYNSDIPEKLEDIVLKALEKDVDARYQTAAELQNALQRFMFSENIYYSAKELSEFCHKMFAQEIALEQKKVEFYKELTRDVLMQAKKPSTDVEDETSFYERQNVPKMSSVQYEVVNKAKQSAPKQAIYAELDDFVPPSNNIVYSQKNSAPPPESLDDIVSSQVNIEKAVPRRSITTDAVVVNKGRETIMTPVVPNQSGSRRNLFIAIVLILFFVIGMILVIGIIHNPKDAQNGQLQFTVYPQDVHFWCEIDNQRVSGEFLNSYIAEQLYTKKETHYRIGADGFQTYEGSVIANPDFQNIDIQLIPASVTKLKMFVDADGATVKVDGEKLDGIKHFEFADITPGEHLVTVTKEGYKPEEKKIFIKSGEELSLSFELKPAFAMLVLKATPYPAKYSIRNVRTGEVVKEGTTNSSGERISQLPIDDRFEIAIYDGDTVIKRSWKPNTDVAIDEDQVLSVTTQHSPNAVAQAQEPSAPSAVAKSTSSSTKSTSSGTSSKKTTQNTSADTSKKPQQPAAAPSPAPAAETSKIPGILLVNSIPPAQIFIDGKNYGETFKKIELPAGTYTIRFVNKEQGINTEQSVTVEAGKKVKVMRQ